MKYKLALIVLTLTHGVKNGLTAKNSKHISRGSGALRTNGHKNQSKFVLSKEEIFKKKFFPFFGCCGQNRPPPVIGIIQTSPVVLSPTVTPQTASTAAITSASPATARAPAARRRRNRRRRMRTRNRRHGRLRLLLERQQFGNYYRSAIRGRRRKKRKRKNKGVVAKRDSRRRGSNRKTSAEGRNNQKKKNN